MTHHRPPYAVAAPLPLFLLLLPVIGCDAGGEAGAPGANESGDEAVTVDAVAARTMSFVEVLRGIGDTAALPDRLASVSPAIEGVVTDVLVLPGEPVTAGQPLARLDDRVARQEVAGAEAAEKEAAAALVLLKAPPREQDRRAAEIEVERAGAAVKLAQAVADRLEPLHARKEISDQQMFETRQRLQDAELARKVAEARLELLIAGARPEAIAEAEARVATAAAAARAAAARLDLYVLVSPQEGVVDRVLCHRGQLLTLGTPAVEVIDAGEVLVTAPFAPAAAARIDPAMAARVSAHDPRTGGPAAGEGLAAKIIAVGQQADPATGTIPVHLRVSNPGAALRAGVVVTVEITLRTIPDALAVPNAALFSAEEGPYIMIVRDGKTAILHPQPGESRDGWTRVTVDGLAAGDLVVTAAAHDLPEGTPVRPRTGADGSEPAP